MNNFYFYNPTKIIFGENILSNITKEISIEKRILIVYGKTSIKQNGIYNRIKEVLKNYITFEFQGIEANPEYEKCLEAVSLIKKNNIDFLLAVGGGSVIDAVKFISLASCYEGISPWEFMIDKSKIPSKSIKYGVVLTLSATGSEMNNSFVISNKKTSEKLVSSAFSTYPIFSLMDPNNMKSLPKEQLINGIVDTYVHILEQYITREHDGIVQDFMAEAYLKTLLKISPEILETRDNNLYKNFMWLSAQVQSGLLNRGIPIDWSTHEIAHQITALTNLDHAKTLAIVIFGVWENQFQYKMDKLAHYAREVFNCNLEKKEAAKLAIKKTEQFFLDLGLKTKFSDYKLDGLLLSEKISYYFKEKNILLGENQSIDYRNIKSILISRV